MLIEDVDCLKTWLTKFLTPICDADPNALARYVVALIKKEKPDEDLRSTCLDQLEVFLQDKTKGFVEVLFDILSSKKYMAEPKAPVQTVATDTAESANGVEKRRSPVREVRPPRQNNKDDKQEGRGRSWSRSASPHRAHRPQSRSPGETRRRRFDDRRLGDRLGPRRDSRSYRFGSGRYPPRRRSPVKNRSKSRSLSPRAPRPYSLSPRAKGRSRSPFSSEEDAPVKRKSPDSRGSTPTEEKERERSKKTRGSASPKRTTQSKPRCEDYNVRGVCLRGDTCPFDHGTDAVVVEDSKLPEVLAYPPPNYPMARPSFNGQPTGGVPVPSGGAIGPAPPPSGGLGNPVAMIRPTEPGRDAYEPDSAATGPGGSGGFPGRQFPHNNSGRQFVKVPTDPPYSQGRGMKRHYRGSGPQYGGKRPYAPGGRMGFNRVKENCTLEIRQVPANMNNIGKLNEHFGKFGSLVNYDNDPEAALITFATNAQALAAYKCPDAVLNNRFVKVFWHKKEQVDNTTSDDLRHTIKERLGYVPSAVNKQQATDGDVAINSQGVLTKTLANPDATTPVKVGKPPLLRNQSRFPQPNPNREVRSPSTDTITSPTSLPAPLAKLIKSISTETDPNGKHPAELQAGVPDSEPQVPKKLSHRKRMQQQEQQQHEALLKKLDIRKQKQLLLTKQLNHQKLLLKKIETTTNDEEKKEIFKTMKNLDASVRALKEQLTTGSKPVVKPAAKRPAPAEVKVEKQKSKDAAKKELLDAELEAMNQTDGDASSLRKKVAALKQQAARMGLAGRGGRGRVGLRVQSRIAVMTYLQGRGSRGTSLDRRPKHLIVTGFDLADKEEVLEHFRIVGDVISEEADDEVPSVTIGFRSRNEAEKAINCQKFRSRVLNFQWFQPPPSQQEGVAVVSKASPRNVLIKSPDNNGTSRKSRKSSDSISEDVLDGGDVDTSALLGLDNEDMLLKADEDDDDDDSRSWRR